MQKYSNKTSVILMKTETEIFDCLVPEDHPFRRLNALLNFEELARPLRNLYSDMGTTGIDVEKGFRALLVQFWEDYSDRQMEKCLRENMAVKYFCGFGVLEDVPAHTYFTKLRTRIGAARLADLFNAVNELLRAKGLFGDVFTFIDASAIVTKTALWDERDKAIAAGEETLNNQNVTDYAADKDARWGAKGKNKIWFGYKRHHAVDMRHGLIRKLAVTGANVLDWKTVKNICPAQGMVFMDKLFDCAETRFWLRANHCADATIRKDNTHAKNRDLDRWRSSIRMPFEGTFSKLNHQARYRGQTKMFFQCTAEAIVHNLKKMLAVLPAPTSASA
jgi:IS5 family transposase